MDGLMEDTTEMSLTMWCNRLPETHLVNKELNKVRTTLALLNSMINCGECHSDISLKTLNETREILRG